jgi:hypothetical protein
VAKKIHTTDMDVIFGYFGMAGKYASVFGYGDYPVCIRALPVLYDGFRKLSMVLGSEYLHDMASCSTRCPEIRCNILK